MTSVSINSAHGYWVPGPPHLLRELRQDSDAAPRRRAFIKRHARLDEQVGFSRIKSGRSFVGTLRSRRNDSSRHAEGRSTPEQYPSQSTALPKTRRCDRLSRSLSAWRSSSRRSARSRPPPLQQQLRGDLIRRWHGRAARRGEQRELHLLLLRHGVTAPVDHGKLELTRLAPRERTAHQRHRPRHQQAKASRYTKCTFPTAGDWRMRILHSVFDTPEASAFAVAPCPSIPPGCQPRVRSPPCCCRCSGSDRRRCGGSTTGASAAGPAARHCTRAEREARSSTAIMPPSGPAACSNWARRAGVVELAMADRCPARPHRSSSSAAPWAAVAMDDGDQPAARRGWEAMTGSIPAADGRWRRGEPGRAGRRARPGCRAWTLGTTERARPGDQRRLAAPRRRRRGAFVRMAAASGLGG